MKFRRLPEKSQAKGIFSLYFYGVLQESDGDCRLVGHFQWHPVGRIYALAWMGLTALISLSVLVVGALRGSPDSTAQDALPFVIPSLLPLILFGLLHLQRRRDRDDEKAIRRWLEALGHKPQEIEYQDLRPHDT